MDDRNTVKAPKRQAAMGAGEAFGPGNHHVDRGRVAPTPPPFHTPADQSSTACRKSQARPLDLDQVFSIPFTRKWNNIDTIAMLMVWLDCYSSKVIECKFDLSQYFSSLTG
ncbi:hypothetical protein U9M48_022720 [Paspalum notatum var. saurae]|uniref:Uncharacterized protein n=1 Tax=Paspalum notatum var. saurae TaxID=547442 RepID=A0AAQ3TNQ2_PASNO